MSNFNQHDAPESGDVEAYRVRLGERLSEVARTRYRSRAAAGRAAGVTGEQYARWEAAAVKVPAEALWRLAQDCGVDFAWLCGAARANGTAPSRTAGGLDPEVMRLVLTAMVGATQGEGGVIYASPEKFAELAGALHDYVMEQRQASTAPPDLGRMGQIIRLASR